MNDTVQSQLPFFFMEKDKEELKKLNEISAGHRERCAEGRSRHGNGTAGKMSGGCMSGPLTGANHSFAGKSSKAGI